MSRKISVLGLGYVGLPVAVAFGKNDSVVAFDINRERIKQLRNGNDVTQELESQELLDADLLLTSHSEDLRKADFHIIAVPTPIDEAKKPNLIPLLKASEMLGVQLKKGDIVVYESTVYPGVTEDICAPMLEKTSGLKCGEDFFIGYSPERMNPGDKDHDFTSIKKVVSGQTPEVLQIIARVYASVVKAGVCQASSIKVAEAAKVIENAQRDINIAFVNELAILFNRMGLSVHEVLEVASSKWNFLPFKPGLVGGHCIGVDPYYLTYKAQELGYHPEVILAGRRINDGMGKYIAELMVKEMLKKNLPVRGAKVAILGFTFKENCPDIRNTRVIDVINELKTYSVDAVVYDPVANAKEVKDEYGIDLANLGGLEQCDALVIAVSHSIFRESVIQDCIADKKAVVDIKNMTVGRLGEVCVL